MNNPTCVMVYALTYSSREFVKTIHVPSHHLSIALNKITIFKDAQNTIHLDLYNLISLQPAPDFKA
jgi:hypothetical protein